MEMVSRRLDVVGVATVVAIAAYAWWATGLRPFSGASLVAVVGSGLAVLVVGSAAPGRERVSGPRAGAGGVAVWGVLLGALVVWELMALRQQPRVDHPTLSYLSNSLLTPHPLRALAFVGWLALGYRLVRR